MAETSSLDEHTFHTKRKPDINGEESQEHPNKARKLDTCEDNSMTPLDEEKKSDTSLDSNNNSEVPNSNCSSVTEGKVEKVESDVVAKEVGDDDGEFDHGGVDNDGDEDEDEDEDEDGEESNGEAEMDRKGKGIMRADKGKGKLIEEDDEDDENDSGDDEDSSDDGVVSDGDSDLSDDPLAEVDLNNILPSRTRRRTVHPGEYIANDMGNDDDDDNSDDSDV